jgi:hypothetical protein
MPSAHNMPEVGPFDYDRKIQTEAQPLKNPRYQTNSSNAERVWLGAAPARWAS